MEKRGVQVGSECRPPERLRTMCCVQVGCLEGNGTLSLSFGIATFMLVRHGLEIPRQSSSE